MKQLDHIIIYSYRCYIIKVSTFASSLHSSFQDSTIKFYQNSVKSSIQLILTILNSIISRHPVRISAIQHLQSVKSLRSYFLDLESRGKFLQQCSRMSRMYNCMHTNTTEVSHGQTRQFSPILWHKLESVQSVSMKESPHSLMLFGLCCETNAYI